MQDIPNCLFCSCCGVSHEGWVADLLLSRVDASAANAFVETQGAWSRAVLLNRESWARTDPDKARACSVKLGSCCAYLHTTWESACGAWHSCNKVFASVLHY